MNFFDFLNSINETKKDLLLEDPLNEKEYVSFMINRGLSQFPDTIMYANEMNRYANIPKKWQYTFYLNAIPKKKRFSKWHKNDAVLDDIKLIKKVYGYSTTRAVEALEILTPEQLQILRDSYFAGGR